MLQSQQAPPAVEVLDGQRVRTHCLKCGEAIVLDFGGLSRQKALEKVAEMNVIPRECPGFHVELTGWRRLWQMDEAIEALYGKEENRGN